MSLIHRNGARPGRFSNTIDAMLAADLFETILVKRYPTEQEKGAIERLLYRWNGQQYKGQPATVFRRVTYKDLVLFVRVE